MICTVLSLFLLATPVASEAQGEPSEMRRARDGNIAIQEELDAARRAGTVEAYDLFLARHPKHPLAAVAREERQVLVDRQRERRT